MIESILISHEVSRFGQLDIVLHGEAAILYKDLVSSGIIDSLKEQDHLGFISKSNPGNHHKRWDYIILQLYIAHKLKNGPLNLGLSSEHKVFGKFKLSGLVLIQLWILFSNLGHLPGTLATEKALFQFLIDHIDAKTAFNSKIDLISSFQSYSEAVFKSKDFYKIKYLIALNFILNKTTNHIIVHSIRALIDQDHYWARKLIWVFSRVRQVCFLYLDSYNSNFPIHIDITKIILNPNHYRTLFNPNARDYNSLLQNTELTLAKKLYLSPQSSINLTHNERGFYSKLKDLRKGKQLDYSNFLESVTPIFSQGFKVSNGYPGECFQYYLSYQDVEFISFLYSRENFENNVNSTYNREKYFTSLLNKNLTNKINQASIIHDQQKNLVFYNIQLNALQLNETEFRKALNNYFALHIEFLKHFVVDFSTSREKALAWQLFTKHYCRKVILQFIRMLFRKSLEQDIIAYNLYEYSRLEPHLFSTSRVLATGLIKGKKHLKSIIGRTIQNADQLPNDITNNIKILSHILDSIKNHRSNFLYCLLPIQVEQSNKDYSELHKNQVRESIVSITDIDAVLIEFTKKRFTAYLIEERILQALDQELKKTWKRKSVVISEFRH